MTAILKKGSVVKFGGKEMNIRYFLYIFYSECSTLFDIEFTIDDEELSLKTEQDVLIDYLGTMQWGYIEQQRVENGYVLLLPALLKNKLLIILDIIFLKTVYNSLLFTKT